MSSNKKIIRYRVGEVPLLQFMAKRLGIKKVLDRYVSTNGNEIISVTDSLLFLIYNLAVGRKPLYKVEEWLSKLDPKMLGYNPNEIKAFNDDRFGRALDRLYHSDLASMVTCIVVEMIKAIDLDLTQIHNDSTSLKAYGKISGTTLSGLFLAYGKSKDHRPDLKQLVYSLTISADGGVPIHYKAYPGNRTDDTTHIETWTTIKNIIGRSDFLYVADCKVCTDKQLTHIVSNHGRVVTVMPETWKECGLF